MKLHLRIAVYRGGAYWKECWESVKENLDLFDGVYISINQSELQEEDIATVRDLRSDKIHLLCQEKYLTAAQHGIVMNNWLKKFHLDGYVYILCHDDILVREGLLELRAMPLQETDAVFCGAHFFSSDGSEVPDPSQEADYTFPVSPEKFVLIHGRLSLNISRLVVPATLFHSKDVSSNALQYGYWAELCYLCSPFIERICATVKPAVKVRVHNQSEGSFIAPDLYLFDFILFRMQLYSRFRSREIRTMAVTETFYMIRKHLFRGTYDFFLAWVRLTRLGYSRFTTGLEMAFYYVRHTVKRTMHRSFRKKEEEISAEEEL